MAFGILFILLLVDGKGDGVSGVDQLAVEIHLQRVDAGFLRRTEQFAHILLAGPHFTPVFLADIMIHNGALFISDDQQNGDGFLLTVGRGMDSQAKAMDSSLEKLVRRVPRSLTVQSSLVGRSHMLT